MPVGIERPQRNIFDTLRRKPKHLVFRELPTGSTIWETGEVTPPGVIRWDSDDPNDPGRRPYRGIRIINDNKISVKLGSLLGSPGYAHVEEYEREAINSVRPVNSSIPRPIWRPRERTK